MSDMPNFPLDLINEILTFLPAKTLLRFRSASKSLCDIIDSPYFINRHLRTTNSNKNTNQKIVLRHYLPYSQINVVPIRVLDMEGPFPPKLNKKILRSRVYPSNSNIVFAHCNGLVLLQESRFSLVVWNPTIRKCKRLPLLPHDEPILYDRPSILGWHIGYDSSIDDYKVLVIKERPVITGVLAYGSYDYREIEYELWILELRSCYWRSIEFPRVALDRFLRNLLNMIRNCFVNVNGAFHFLCGDVIFAFDLAKETFSEVSTLPEEILAKDRHRDLAVLEGCLCVTLYSLPEEHFELHARRKNDRGDFFWNKLFYIRREELSCAHSRFYRLCDGLILGFSKDRGKLYVLYGQNRVYSYDFQEKTLTSVLVADDVDSQKLFPCIETLVWIYKTKRRLQTLL